MMEQDRRNSQAIEQSDYDRFTNKQIVVSEHLHFNSTKKNHNYKDVALINKLDGSKT